MTTLPITLSDACVSISVGAAIRDIVAPLVDGVVLDERSRPAAEVIVASFFLPMLAREDRIAAYLGMEFARVRKMGWRLRMAGIWVGERLAPDCYASIFDENPSQANVALAMYAGVALGSFWGSRRADGELVLSLDRPLLPMHFEGALCSKCWTTRRYSQTGVCVECRRQYMRRYFARSQSPST